MEQSAQEAREQEAREEAIRECAEIARQVFADSPLPGIALIGEGVAQKILELLDRH